MSAGRLAPLGLALLMVALILFITLTGCGQPGSTDDIDRRYQECIDAGGDFTTTGPNDWTCTGTDPSSN
jgi:hypothetical protein